MATGYTNSISGTAMGVQIRFYYSTSYNAATNTSTVTLTPYLYTTSTTGGARGYNGSVYGNGSSIYNMAAGYTQDANLYAQSTSSSWQSFTPVSGSLSTFTISHNNSGVASFTAGYSGKVRAVYDGTTASVSNATGCSASITVSRSLYISYNANGGSGAPGNTYFYGSTEGITLSSTVPTRTGYTFLGWATSSSASTATYSAGQYIGTRSSNLALYAVWSVSSYNITLTAGNFIDSVSGAGMYEYMSSVTVSAVLGSATGYTYAFDGWYDEDTKVSSSLSYTFTMPASAVSLTAVGTRSINSYTLSFNANGGEGAPEAITKNYGVTITLPATIPTRTDYRFLGWSTNNSATTPDYLPESSYTITENSILYAVWEEASAGSVRIDNGSSFDVYLIYIDNGTSWDQYVPYIDNGTSWDIYS